MVLSSSITLVICDKNHIVKEIIGQSMGFAVNQPIDETQINCPFDKKVGDSHIYYLLFSADYRKDPLTQLFSREVLDDSFTRLITNQQRFVCVLIDIDNLKSINDNDGHQAGDKALITLADYLKTSFRKDDTLIRYGGDEFLLLLPIGGNATAEIMIELINQRLQESPIEISWGNAIFPMDANTQHELIACADKRLYAMKQTKK